ncbi:MAG: tRNA pseudouridine(38-40) synthase TruA [Actinomycetota bacterium]|jgi:tRNA pseudouridine38-40 synthase
MSAPAGETGGLTRFRIDLSYDGTDFAGWAKQPNLRTVQGELLSALSEILGQSEDDFFMRVGGRTDAGVHADHQVCHIDLNSTQLKRVGRNPLSAQRINSLLPADVAVLAVEEAKPGFDARFSATGRSYVYAIADGQCAPNPKWVRYTLTHPKVLSVEKMNAAAKKLLGLKDFGAFCKPREGATTIRELRKLSAKRERDGRILVSVSADAFCHNMVRALVGALIAVGEGRLTSSELSKIQKEAKRTSAFKVVGPHGLSLSEIRYPPASQLAKQAQKARNIRSFEEISV